MDATRVFINCPYDDEYIDFLHAIIFAVIECGFLPTYAFRESAKCRSRLEKIFCCLREATYSIHDISLAETCTREGVPRLNMSFECGLAYGISYSVIAGGQEAQGTRDALVLSRTREGGMALLSDLAGHDVIPHDGSRSCLLRAVRNFLVGSAVDQDSVPDHESMLSRLDAFDSYLKRRHSPRTGAGLATRRGPPKGKIYYNNLRTFHYVGAWHLIATRWIRDHS